MARRRTEAQQRAMATARAHAELNQVKAFLSSWANGTDSIQRVVGSWALLGISARERHVLHGQDTMEDLLRYIRDEMPADLENALCNAISKVVADLQTSLS